MLGYRRGGKVRSTYMARVTQENLHITTAIEMRCRFICFDPRILKCQDSGQTIGLYNFWWANAEETGIGKS